MAVHARLNQIFGERVLSLQNNTEWPPGSPALIPCQFLAGWGRGYLKDKVFSSPSVSLSVPRQKIITEGQLLRGNMGSCADTCAQRGGGYVEGNL